MIKKKFKITNVKDLMKLSEKLIKPEEVRSIEVEAIIYTGARMLVLPEDLVKKLGLDIIDKRTVRYANGERAEKNIASTIELEIIDKRLEVGGRKTHCDVMVEKIGAPVLVGQIPMEDMDLLVDMSKEDVMPNPESPYTPMVYLY